MPTLLHIDSSLNGATSVSREVAHTFRETWEAENPGGTVVYRDLNAEPLPHLDAVSYYSASTAAEERTPEQQQAYELRDKLASELESADAVLLGAPLYNYSIPSTLKSWLDHVIIRGRTSGVEQTTVAGKPTFVVSSRGGSYAPGTPMEGNDFAHPYLNWVLAGSMKLDVTFIIPELTLAPVTPGMEQLVDKAHASRAQAHEQARQCAKALAAA